MDILSQEMGGWLPLVSHLLTALLGGGLAALITALTDRDRARLDGLDKQIKNYGDDREWYAKRYNEMQAQLRELRSTVWELRNGVAVLQAQLIATGASPEWEVPQDAPPGHRPLTPSTPAHFGEDEENE